MANNTNRINKADRESEVRSLLEPTLIENGYRIVAIEFFLSGPKRMQIFIDFNAPGAASRPAIGIEDCVVANKLIDDIVESSELLSQIFKGQFDLEVSSPGLERPLRRPEDFINYQGEKVKLQLFRSLNETEIGNRNYLKSNPKQKKFDGILLGLNEDRVRLSIIEKPNSDDRAEIEIPLELISKAHLNPDLDDVLAGQKGTKRA